MKLSITESNDLFSRDLNMYWEDFTKTKTDIVSNIIKTKNLLIEIYHEILKINNIEKDKHNIVQIITGFLSMVEDHVKELSSFEEQEKSFVTKQGEISEKDRLDVVKILERNQFLEFKTSMLLDNIYDTFTKVIESNKCINDLTKTHILNILNKVKK